MIKIHYSKALSLNTNTVGEIWNFYNQYIHFVDKALWHKFLFESDQVFVIRDKNNAIQGCGTIAQHIVHWKNKKYGILYTGITAYHPEFRGKNLTQRIGFRSFLRFKLKNLFVPVYWLFFAGTYKSYLLMSRNFSKFWPSQQSRFPEKERHLIQDIMQNRFHQDWNANTGVLSGQGGLHFYEGINSGKIPKGDPNADFFYQQNPGVAQGDALICIAPLSLRNWFKIVGRSLWTVMRNPFRF